MSNRFQLELHTLLPQIPDADDRCVDRLRSEVEAAGGIDKAHLKRVDGKLMFCVHFDDGSISPPQIEKLMRRESERLCKQYKHHALKVAGMHCADCAARIERAAAQIPGVESAQVNFASERAVFEYDSEKVNLGAIRSKIQKLGYKLESSQTPARRISPYLLLSLVSGAFLLAGFLVESLTSMPFAYALAAYVAAYIAGGYHASLQGLRAARQLQFDIDFLMVVAALGAAILGEWADGALLLFLFSLGHALEHAAMEKARNAIRGLTKLAPETARIRKNGGEQVVAISEIGLGDMVIVRAGERLPVDGTIREGASEFDESPITGESIPVSKDAGDPVFAGTINGDGAVEIETTRLSSNSMLARVVRMVEDAQAKKSESQRFAQRLTKIFVPSILVLVAIVWIVPPLAGWLTWPAAFLRAMTVLVGASPCALAISTPAAVLAGIAQAARQGVLIKGGIHLENLGSVRAIAFDKTGTITAGKPRVTDVVPLGSATEADVVLQAASLESRTQHPLAAAIVEHAGAAGIPLLTPEAVRTVPGKGIAATLQGASVQVGNARLFLEDGELPDEVAAEMRRLEAEGKTSVLVRRDGRFTGLIALADEPRPTAKATLEALRALGIRETIMLTGDNPRVAAAVAQRVGLQRFEAGLLPQDKVEAVRKLLNEHGGVAMVGDGINDAPALATASVGIAMGSAGADVALETADVALMSDALERLPFAFGLSRQARRIILQNFTIALGVIAMLIPSALFGWATIGLAIVFHEGSTVLVVLNALRLLNYK